jgi:hypothetical protein
MRRWLVRKLLGERLYFQTLQCLNQGLDDWTGCITDPTMYKEADDMEAIAEIREDMKVLDEFWFPERVNDSIYKMTEGLEQKL